MEDAVKSGLDALATAQQLAAAPLHPGCGRDVQGGVGNAFKELAHLIKGGANVRVATIGMGGYDTHENQGTDQGGYLYSRLNELARAMNAFFDRPGRGRLRRHHHGVVRVRSAGGAERHRAPTTATAAWWSSRPGKQGGRFAAG